MDTLDDLKHKNGEWVLVRADALPSVYTTVLQVKNDLAQNPLTSVSEAARRCGLSRSAYYKYRDAVKPYYGNSAAAMMTVRVLLQDSPGVLSGLLSAFAKSGANVLTVDQQAPNGGCAAVTICIQADRLTLPTDLFAEQIARVPGVQRVLEIKDQTQ